MAEASGLVGFQIGVNAAQIARAQALLDPKQYRVAMQAAVSRTISTGQTRVNKAIRETVNLKRSDVAKLITLKRPSYDNLQGKISIVRKPVPLKEFNPKEAKKGVRVKVWKDQPAQVLKGTFIQRTPRSRAGAIGVLERQRIGGGKRARRFPTNLRFGPTAITALEGNKKRAGILPAVSVDLTDVLAKNIDSQIDRFIK